MIKRLVHRAIDNFGRRDHDASYTIDASPPAISLFSRATGLVAATALTVGIGLAAPAAGHISAPPSAVSAYTLTSRRIGASIGVAVALIGAVIGSPIPCIARETELPVVGVSASIACGRAP
jgi:hypothetical protein